MKILLYGKDSSSLEQLVKSLGFEIVTSSPDVVISYGGDGTLLFVEREFPSVPKLPIRNSQFCHKCPKHEDKVVLKKLLEKKLDLKEHKKLNTNASGQDLYALNDFVIRNDLPTHAIRFKILVSDTIPSELYVGDGIVVSTPFGSTGYFKSVSGETFKDGFALVLNNVTQKSGPTYIDQDETDKEDDFDRIGFRLVRGKAILAYDNSPDIFHISESTTLSFKLSDKVAKIYEDTSLRCPDCVVKRD